DGPGRRWWERVDPPRDRPAHDRGGGRFRRRRDRRCRPAAGKPRAGRGGGESGGDPHIWLTNSSGPAIREHRGTGAMAMAQKQAMTVTDRAGREVEAVVGSRGKPSIGVRVGVRARGCSGLSYTLEYADEKGKFDEVVETNGVTILVDPKAVMFILGTEMDYVE